MLTRLLQLLRVPERQEHIAAVQIAAAAVGGTRPAADTSRARAGTGASARNSVRAAANASKMTKRDGHARSARAAELCE